MRMGECPAVPRLGFTCTVDFFPAYTYTNNCFFPSLVIHFPLMEGTDLPCLALPQSITAFISSTLPEYPGDCLFLLQCSESGAWKSTPAHDRPAYLLPAYLIHLLASLSAISHHSPKAATDLARTRDGSTSRQRP